MIADAVKSFATQVERHQCHVGAPHGVVVAAFDIWRECVFTGVSAGPVATVMAECNGFGQCHVEPECAGDRHGDLGDLESVGESRALVVLRKHKYLGFASQASERRCMQDAITVAFKARAKRIGLFCDGAVASAK